MKTTNNVQKAIKKTLAVIISLVLLSITVNAQNFWRAVLENSSFNQIAMAMVDAEESNRASDKAYTTNYMDAYAGYFKVETEEAMELENWMVNENNFFYSVAVEVEADNSLELENWMTNETLFDGTAAFFEVEADATLELEDWMKSMDYFGVQKDAVEECPDEVLELEAWMTNNKIWGK